MFEVVTGFLKTYHSSLATLITGGFAWYLYYRAKNDEIKTAAKIVILEIKEAEKIIKIFLDVKNSGENYPGDFFKVIPYKAWEKHSHLFVKKLNNDEYEQITEFYKKCEVFERYIEKNYNFFWVTIEERARQKERIGADYALKIFKQDPNSLKKVVPKEHFQQIEDLALLYMSNTGVYTPAGIKTEIDRVLNSVSMIKNTPTWNKLKKIGDYRDLLG